MSFVHLHVHSHFSLLDGLTQIPDLVARAKELNMPALALTDHGSMYGAIEFYKACTAHGIKPIIGMEAYIAPRALHLKKGQQDSKNFHITLLAKNITGYKNLMTLSSIGYLDGFYYKPRVDRPTLTKYSEGIICLSGCPKGEIRQAIIQGNNTRARELVREYRTIFNENFYIEIQRIKWHTEAKKQQQEQEIQQLIHLAREEHIAMVATNDIHYIYPHDNEVQDVMVCINTGKTIDEKNRLDMRDADVSFYTPNDMQELFKDYPEALANTLHIANAIDCELDLTTWHYPQFQLPSTATSPEQYLNNQVYAGVKKIYSTITTEVKERIEYELDIINHKKYADYFLIVADFMQWARENGILTTSRGSASGSLVSYCLGITSVDPLEYGLPFERFMTKQRPTPPDMDIDMQDDRRDDIINYVRSKYGYDRVAQICTFGTMMARGSFRDVARTLGKPAAWADMYAKMIPFGSQGFPMTLEKALKESPDIKKAYTQDHEVKRVYEIAKRIEGCARHVSVHAAGVVITPSKLTDFLPLQIEPKGRNIITQYDMYALDPNVSKESVGLLKMDFLGLRNLTILSRCVKLVAKIKKKIIDIYAIPLNDDKTFNILAQGYTFGVFQLSSNGMTRYLKELKPTEVSHLMAMVALYRPGPMEFIPEYIKRKNNPQTIQYPDDRLKEILKMSYGLLIYQDDILLTAIHLAGYEPDEADAFRKAMGKKIPEVMQAQKEKFFTGCNKNGLDNKKIQEIWNMIEPFAAYGFNKAHAASYGMLAYRTAYMKANYASEYMTAYMSCEAANSDKIAEAIHECRRLGIEVSAPNVNISRGDFTYISDTQISFGLSAIKNLGNDIITTIIEERKNHGTFTSLEDFLTRVKSKNFNKKSLEALIKAGALDCLGNRSHLYNNVEKILSFTRYSHQHEHDGQESLFAQLENAPTVSLKLELDHHPIAPFEQLKWEKELLGLYVTDHPMKSYAHKLPQTLFRLESLPHTSHEQQVIFAGVVNVIKKYYTKNKDAMLFVTIEDTTGQSELIVFPRTLEQQPEIWQEQKALLVTGKVSVKDNERKIIVQKAYELDTMNKEVIENAAQANKDNTYHAVPNRQQTSGYITVYFKNMGNIEQVNKLKSLFSHYPGKYPIHLELGQNGKTKKIVTAFAIDYNEQVKEKIEHITGHQTVHVIETS